MRRKESYINTGIAVGALLGAGVNLINQLLNQHLNGESLSLKKIDGGKLLKSSICGAVIGGGTGYIYHYYTVNKESEQSFGPDHYLSNVLLSERLSTDDEFTKEVFFRKNQIRKELSILFRGMLVSEPIVSGSIRKGTAISSNFDLDITLVFKRTSYSSLENMYSSVYKKLYESYCEHAKVKRHTKAISIVFLDKKYPISIDIVPGREIGDFMENKELNLYNRPNWVWQKGSSCKTNLYTQTSLGTRKSEIIDLIKLIKVYNERNKLNIPKVIIEQRLVNAFREGEITLTKSLATNFLNSLIFLTKVLKRNFVPDIANTNNNLNAKISGTGRFDIISFIESDVEKIKENPSYFIECFEVY